MPTFTLTPQTFARLVAGALIVIGLLVLSQKSTVTAPRLFATGLTETVDCGRAISPTTMDDPDRQEACADKHRPKQIPGWIMLGLGVLVLGGTLLVRWPTRPVPAETSESVE
ncbi:MAG TPA: hypothetical protein VFV67_34060 [Actinophytocola sp.]|uniref:hypothetical protein n=1 Tax=Actinophytocola sp. TaxID=1872138 RepID=UPI002DBAA864|nr:hypothetical protein [Actinophytocola sp.]HEU5475693.1 hypothetical protein [Actinophytocola sp.]